MRSASSERCSGRAGMDPEGPRMVERGMPLYVRLLLLSLVAGCVDAIGFVRAGVFPANMTGNSVVLALALVHVPVGGLVLPAIALAGFCLGAALGAWFARQKPATGAENTSLALGLAGGLLLAAAALAAIGATGVAPVLLAAMAMGMQSATAQHLGVAGVATVVVTGTLTTAIGRMVGAWTRGKPLPVVAGGLPAGSWLAYLVGAITGGLQSAPHLGGLILLPGLGLIIAALGRRGGQRAGTYRSTIG